MADIGLSIGGIGGIGGAMPIANIQIGPVGPQVSAGTGSGAGEESANVVVTLSDAALRALALEAAVTGAMTASSRTVLDDLALAALLALLMNERERDSNLSVAAATAIKAYLIAQALG